MSAIDGLKTTLNKGDYFSVQAYKSYFKIKSQQTANYVVESNGSYYWYLDWHEAKTDFVEVPTQLSGLSFDVVDKSDNVTLLSKQATSEISVDISNASNYGYLVLKFKK